MHVRRLSTLTVICIGMMSGQAAFGDLIFNVTIDTSAVKGSSGSVVFDYTTSNPAPDPFSGSVVTITNYNSNGQLGLPATQGGLVTGDLILSQTLPAAFNTMNDGFFFNELSVNYVQFGTTTTFGLDLTGAGPPLGNPPDEFSLFVLDSTGNPISTSDPLGVNALLVADVTGQPGGMVSAFSPAVLDSATGNLKITVPGGGPPPTVPEPSTFMLMSAALFCLGIVQRFH